VYLRLTIVLVALGLSAASAAADKYCSHSSDIELSRIGAEITTPQFVPEIGNVYAMDTAPFAG
jgi:hypothetical protein